MQSLRLAALAPLALLAAGCGGGGEAPSAGADSPNVVVVMTDDQDVASLEVMPIVRRELVDRGVEFTNSYVGVSECCPSRATFLTGQHAHNHGVVAAGPPDGGYAKLDSSNTLATWLDEHGYRTAQVGRYLNFYGNPKAGTDPREVPPGWDDWHVPVNHTEFQLYDYDLNENGRITHRGSAPGDYSTHVLAATSVDFISQAAGADEPFFLSITPSVPHSEGVLDGLDAPRNPRPAPGDEGALAARPFPRPPSFAEADVSDKPALVQEKATVPPGSDPDPALVADYLSRVESLLAVDRLVGDVIAELERTGELEQTYVIFTSDNGFLLGEHGQVGKHLAYEESVRVPLVIRGPGLPAGERRHGLVQNIDLAPTIVEITGAGARREMDGTSLLPMASDPEAGTERDLLIEFLESALAYKAVRTSDGYIYVAYDAGPRELYDLDRDPFQLENLAGARGHRETEARLAKRLEGLRDCAGSDCL